MINKIATKTYFNIYSRRRFYIIEVDGKSLEEIILENRPDILKGLVPSLLNWLSDEEERKEVWERVKLVNGKKKNLPILMCEDDVDLWCTLIMVEVESDENFVYWNKFGLENSDAVKPEQIGKSIEWFGNIPSMKFDRVNYEQVIEKFARYLEDNTRNTYPADPGEIVYK